MRSTSVFWTLHGAPTSGGDAGATSGDAAASRGDGVATNVPTAEQDATIAAIATAAVASVLKAGGNVAAAAAATTAVVATTGGDAVAIATAATAATHPTYQVATQPGV